MPGGLAPEPIGGWSYVLLSENGFERENFGTYTPATNNSMEILAAIMGILSLPVGSQISVYSDSAYLVNTMRNQWWKDWESRDWRKSGGNKETPNKQFWIQLVGLCKNRDVKFIKVKGHDGDWLNERCDYLAKFARKRTEREI